MSGLDQESWDNLQARLGASFLQSSYWETFQKALGHNTYRLDGPGWSALLIEHKTKVGTYLFAPYGPTLAVNIELPVALNGLVEHAKKLGADWLRVEPCEGFGDLSQQAEISWDKVKQKFNLTPKQVNPEHTSMIDLRPEINGVMAKLSQSTRRNIRKGLKDQTITYRTSTDPSDMKVFVEMLGAVSKRNNVHFYSNDYFMKQAEILMPLGVMKIELVLKENKPIAGIVMHYYNQVSTYTYAASHPEARGTNASTLALWRAIENSKAMGMEYLDLFGIALEDIPPSHPWYGFSAFKRTFGGVVIPRSRSYDLPLSRHYYLYKAAFHVRKRLRTN